MSSQPTEQLSEASFHFFHDANMNRSVFIHADGRYVEMKLT